MLRNVKKLLKNHQILKKKKKFESLVTEIDKASIPIKHRKPQLKINVQTLPIKNIYPRSHVFTMKIIGARGMGKTICPITFLHSLIFEGIIKYEDVIVFCPTSDHQEQWKSSGFQRRNFVHMREEYALNKLLVFEDMQLDTKGNKLIQTLYRRGRHDKTGIIQCEQFTPDTAHLKKANTDYFVLVPTFSEYAA